jgi:glucose dehydrogenase
MLRAYDKQTGKEVGAVMDGRQQQSGSPMTYMVDGKQYIVVAVRRRQLFGRIHRVRSSVNPKDAKHDFDCAGA